MHVTYNFSRANDGLTASFTAHSRAQAERETLKLLSFWANGHQICAILTDVEKRSQSMLIQPQVHELARRGFVQLVEDTMSSEEFGLSHIATMDRVGSNAQYVTIYFANGDWTEVACYIGLDGSFCFELLWEKDGLAGAEAFDNLTLAVRRFCEMTKELDV
jgi:hypothetical protein